jgi:hypothetical protein
METNATSKIQQGKTFLIQKSVEEHFIYSLCTEHFHLSPYAVLRTIQSRHFHFKGKKIEIKKLDYKG